MDRDSRNHLVIAAAIARELTALMPEPISESRIKSRGRLIAWNMLRAFTTTRSWNEAKGSQSPFDWWRDKDLRRFYKPRTPTMAPFDDFEIAARFRSQMRRICNRDDDTGRSLRADLERIAKQLGQEIARRQADTGELHDGRAPPSDVCVDGSSRNRSWWGDSSMIGERSTRIYARTEQRQFERWPWRSTYLDAGRCERSPNWFVSPKLRATEKDRRQKFGACSNWIRIADGFSIKGNAAQDALGRLKFQ